MSRKTRSDLIKLAVLWVAISIVAEAGTAYLIGQYPTMASRQGLVTAEAIAILLWITVPVFVLVVLVIVYSMIRFRVADDDQESSEAQYRTGRAFPWGWVAVSTVLNLLFIIYPGVTGLSSIWSMAEAATEPLEVEVTASQWEWAFSYPREQLADQSELVVPVNRPVRFALRTKDAIHSFWVPAWGLKKAVIPGPVQTLVITPTRIVDTATNPMARVQCSQICGAGHAEMRAVIRVVSQSDFAAWVQAARGQRHDMDMPGMKMDMPGMKMDMPMGEPPRKPAPDSGAMPMDRQMDMGGQKMPGMKMDMPMGEPPRRSAPDSGAMPMDRQMNMGGQKMPGMKMDMPGMETPKPTVEPSGKPTADTGAMPMDHQMDMGGQKMPGMKMDMPGMETPKPTVEPSGKPAPDSGAMPMDRQMDMGGQK